MAFIQCFLTVAALGWYIRLHDSYKQDWSAFAHASKKLFFLKRTVEQVICIIITHIKQITNLLIPMIDIVVEVHHARVVQVETFHHNMAFILEIDTDVKELLSSLI